MDSPLSGFFILDGNRTQVRLADGLVSLYDIVAGASDGFTKAETNALWALKENLLTTSIAPGITVWDSTLNTVRNILGAGGVTVALGSNGSIVVDGSGGGGVPSSIAEFTETVTKHHKLTECLLGLTVMNGISVDLFQATSIIITAGSLKYLLQYT